MNSRNQSYYPCLDDVAEAIADDDRVAARDYFEANNEIHDCPESLMIQAWVCESPCEMESHLQHLLQIDPNNEVALSGINWIRGVRNWANDQLEKRRQLEAEAEAVRLEEEEALRQAAEEARVQAEEEAARVAAEEARLSAEKEAARIAAENAIRLAAAEELRAKEEARLEAKEARQQAELEISRLNDEERTVLEVETEALGQEVKDDSAGDEEAATLTFETKTESLEIPIQTELWPNEPLQVLPLEAEVIEGVEQTTNEIREQIQNSGSGETQAGTQSFEGAVVLAVDDSPTVRKLVAMALKQEGFEVITAEDGFKALSILAQRLPDIILSDINMPKLNGYKLCKFVKKHDRTRHIPVVMLSGKDGVFDKMRGKMSGCNDFLSKPFESTELVAKVRENLASVAAS